MSESPEPNKHLPLDVLKNYLIYTTSQPIPQISETLGTRRCILRIIQLMAAAGAFATIFYTSIANTPSSLRVYKSGVTMMTFTSIIGFFVASTFMIAQLYPQHLNISPDRYLRFSKTEISFDFLLMALWVAASTALLLVGNDCQYNAAGGECVFILSSVGLGYLASFLFAFSMVIGITDTIRYKDQSIFKSKDHIMFARGNWKY